MEHAQRIRQEFVYDRRYYVLILILMEHAQRVVLKLVFRSALISLNPYFNGTCSKRGSTMTFGGGVRVSESLF